MAGSSSSSSSSSPPHITHRSNSSTSKSASSLATKESHPRTDNGIKTKHAGCVRVGSCPHILARRAQCAGNLTAGPASCKFEAIRPNHMSVPALPPCPSLHPSVERAWRPWRARLHCRDDPVQRRSGFWIRNGFHSPLATKLAWAGRHLAECMDHAWMRLQAALLVEVAFGFVATYSSN